MGDSSNNGVVNFGVQGSVVAARGGLRLPSGLPFGDWSKIGGQLSAIADASSWWMGDWLVYGEMRYPERYKLAIEKVGLDYQTLRNYAWVSRKFSHHRRRCNLSFKHHAEVASLEEADQDEWLDRAERLGWSANRLRQYLKAATSSDSEDNPKAVERSGSIMIVPSEEALWQQAAQRMNRSLEQWIVAVLDEAAKAVVESNDEHAISTKALETDSVS